MDRRAYIELREQFINDLEVDNITDLQQDLHAKLQKGYEEYGDRSYSLTYEALLREVLDECVDIPGWLSIVYGKLREEGRDTSRFIHVAKVGVLAYVMTKRLLEDEKHRTESKNIPAT